MARKCKCFVTGAIGNTDDFVKGANGKYFCSLAVYQEFCRKTEQRKEIIRIIAEDILGYQSGQVFPTYLTKGLKDFDFYDTEVVLKTLKKNQESIRYYMGKKDFRDDVAKLHYIYAALKNNINGVYNTWLAEKRAEQRQKSTDTADIETLASGAIQEQQRVIKQKTRDISDWLGDDN